MEMFAKSLQASFPLYRSFSYLHTRVLLALQDEICSLEEELEKLDEIEVEEPKQRIPTSEGGNTREDILRKIKNKLYVYDEILIKACELDSFSCPPKCDYSSIRRWFEQDPPFELRKGRGWAGFDQLIEQTLKFKSSNGSNTFERSHRFEKSLRGDGDGLGHHDKNSEPISTSRDVWPTFTARIIHPILLMRRACRIPNGLPAWPFLLAFLNTASAAPIPNHSNGEGWKQRALHALTESLISCAFLVAPAIILLLCSITATALRYFKKDGSAILGMIGLAAVLSSIRAPTSGIDGEDDIRFIELAIEMGYGMLVLVYCELVMLRNNGGKIFCFINTCIAGAATLALMAFTSFNPVFAFSMTLPLSFALCDVVVDIGRRIDGHERIE